MNLAIDAIHAMPLFIVVDGGIAELQPGAYVAIRVADNGTGMDTQTPAQIFAARNAADTVRIAREHLELRVLFVSGFAADEGVLERGFELMQKPFSMQALRLKSNNLLPARSSWLEKPSSYR